MSTAAKTLAQAKINLFLRVLGMERDGFHAIETLFLRVGLGDDVTVRVTDLGRAIDCEGLEGVPAEKNLAFRAAEAFIAVAGWPRGFSIEISKRIPAGAGLGGGSADAAAVLRILNALAPEPLGDQALLELAATLGSDIPFLVGPAVMALAWGRGERLLALEPLPKKPILILVPDFEVSTADAYAALDRMNRPQSSALFMEASDLASWEAVAGAAQNDFEPVVGADHPEIPRLLATLTLAGAQISRMTGTGSAIFAVFDDIPQALPLMSTRMILLTTLSATSVVPVTVLD